MPKVLFVGGQEHGREIEVADLRAFYRFAKIEAAPPLSVRQFDEIYRPAPIQQITYELRQWREVDGKTRPLYCLPTATESDARHALQIDDQRRRWKDAVAVTFLETRFAMALDRFKQWAAANAKVAAFIKGRPWPRRFAPLRLRRRF